MHLELQSLHGTCLKTGYEVNLELERDVISSDEADKWTPDELIDKFEEDQTNDQSDNDD